MKYVTCAACGGDMPATEAETADPVWPQYGDTVQYWHPEHAGLDPVSLAAVQDEANAERVAAVRQSMALDKARARVVAAEHDLAAAEAELVAARAELDVLLALPPGGHRYVQVEDDVPQCRHCGLPKEHRNHPQPTRGPAPSTRSQSAPDRRRAAPIVDAEWDSDSNLGRVLAVIAARGAAGATDDELFHDAALDGMSPNTIRPRRVDLKDAGLVELVTNEKGEPVTRPTSSGRGARAWRLTVVGERLVARKVADEPLTPIAAPVEVALW